MIRSRVEQRDRVAQFVKNKYNRREPPYVLLKDIL